MVENLSEARQRKSEAKSELRKVESEEQRLTKELDALRMKKIELQHAATGTNPNFNPLTTAIVSATLPHGYSDVRDKMIEEQGEKARQAKLAGSRRIEHWINVSFLKD